MHVPSGGRSKALVLAAAGLPDFTLAVRTIRFTSKSFQIELICKQVKVCQKESTFDTCMITHNSIKQTNPTNDGDDNNDSLKESTESNIPVVDDDLPDTISNHVSSGTDDIICRVENKEEMIYNENMYDNTSKKEMQNPPSGMFSENTKGHEHTVIEFTSNDTVDNNSRNTENDNTSLVKPIAFNECSDSIDHRIDEGLGELHDESSERINNVNNIGIKDVNETEEDNMNKIENGSIDLTDISSSFNNESSTSPGVTSLKEPQEIYYEIYKIAKEKAREHKVKSITHYLEAKNIKNQYLLDDLDESDPDDDVNDYYYDSDVTN